MNKHIRQHKITTLANGAELCIYLHELVGGGGDQPTVGICAGIHGNERTGTEIVWELARSLERQSFKGRLLLLPVANPLAFEANRRHAPVDDLNMNRLFPGDEHGWHSEQLAETVTRELLTKVDVLIDLHSGGDRPTVDYVYIRNAEELSRSFGSRVLYRAEADKVGTMFEGTSLGVTEKRGMPSVTVEIGGGLIDQRPYVSRGLRGVRNMLATLGVLDETPSPPPSQIIVNAIHTIRPRMGGFLDSESCELGETLGEGAVLGRVTSPHTFEELEVIRNPVPEGVLVLSHLTRNVVQAGDYGYMVGAVSKD